MRGAGRSSTRGRGASPQLQASWLKTAEVIDFVRAVRARRAYGIHDAQVNERGLASVNGWLAQEAGPGYRWLPPGGTL
ncbi:hypothetical protein [Nonomuraea sp. B1E8]|uniref:hypothetical protein n=1 Tax=unclassified Nonomuraea TaxID=2593643 RepID=UPI00325C4E0C